ncbi:hypothetical protein ACFWA1_19425 [Streptomyces sp. NPDC060005]|uniref:hypothetical protein n=1 Tax=Streptomyces sp. NPDC060005 TaxID=3347034 RepID=UPI003677317E
MSDRRHPHLKSISTTPDGPQDAAQPVDNPVVGEPKGVAEGVPTALPRSKRFPAGEGRGNGADPTPDRPCIRIYAPAVYRHHKDGVRWSTRHGDTPNAAYACGCGQTRTAIGAHAVAALVADYDAHKNACTGTPGLFTEGRKAA